MKLTYEDKIEIYQLRKQGESLKNLSKYFTLATQGLEEQKIPSARALNEGYQKGRTFVTLVDGFIISDNIQFNHVQAHDLEFQHSDHNPVSMSFTLK